MNDWDKALEYKQHVARCKETNITNAEELAAALGEDVYSLSGKLHQAFGVANICTLDGFEGWVIASNGAIVAHKVLAFPFLLSEFKSLVLDIQIAAADYERYARRVDTAEDLAHALSTDLEHLDYVIHKETTCGAYLVASPGDYVVKVGAVVEGTDHATEEFTLILPFLMSELWDILAEVETQAKEIWDNCHGCPDCYAVEGEEFLAGTVDPACPTCNGEGIVI